MGAECGASGCNTQVSTDIIPGAFPVSGTIKDDGTFEGLFGAVVSASGVSAKGGIEVTTQVGVERAERYLTRLYQALTGTLPVSPAPPVATPFPPPSPPP